MNNYIFLRLREERERLALSQAAMGEIGGVKKLTQLNYEKGERVPDAAYFAAVAKIGVDIQYVITGERATVAIPKEELELMQLYRAAPLAVKAAVLAALTAGTSAASSKVHVTGSGNRVAGDNYYEKK